MVTYLWLCEGSGTEPVKGVQMRDVVFVSIVVAFFGICIAYVRACEKLIDR